MFYVGYPLQILGRITASPATCVTKGLQSGSLSLRAPRSQNGEYPVLVPSCGFTGNVRCCPTLMLLWRLIDFLIIAGAGKGVFWYVKFRYFHLGNRTYQFGQFRNYPGRRHHASSWDRVSGNLLF